MSTSTSLSIYVYLGNLMLTDPVAHVPVQEAQQLLGSAG